jgi:SAM-dependent methyltransferase
VSCRLCGADPVGFWTLQDVPTSSNVLFATREAALAQPTGEVALEVCPVCGFIQNGAFDPAAVDYLAPYEESQASSPTFRRFAEETIDRLLGRYQLTGKTVLEVGCGKAEWLAMLCRKGDMTGVGIDPAYVPGRVPTADEHRFEVITEFFGPDSALTGDLVACRHTLEHVANAGEFAGWLASAAARTPGSILFVEVPDTDRILTEGAFWDVYYEHCAYFTTTSLQNLAAIRALTVRDLRRGYSDQYLLLEASPSGEAAPLLDPAKTVESALSFGKRAGEAIDRWTERLDGAGRVVLWAATSKTVGFVSATGADAVAVVDINPAKQSGYLPGSGLPILAPEDLGGIDPDLVLAMNPVYVDEIAADLERLGVGAPLVALEPG